MPNLNPKQFPMYEGEDRSYASDKNLYTKTMKRGNQSRKAKIENRVAQQNKQYGDLYGKSTVPKGAGQLSTVPPKDMSLLKMRYTLKGK